MLDDDPTGSQEATGVPVLLTPGQGGLAALLNEHAAVYAITNTRSLTEGESCTLLTRLRAEIGFAEKFLGIKVLVVQRGDSTLRGHVFPEIDVFVESNSIVVFVPAYPAGGRRTRAGVHSVLVDDVWINVADTEFATDPVFNFRSRTIVEYVAEKSARRAISCPAAEFLAVAESAVGGTVIVPDAETDSDLAGIADDVLTLIAAGRSVVVRCAAPLAAYLAGVKSTRMIELTSVVRDGPVLVVAGSHTKATSAQLARLLERWPHGVQLGTDAAIADPVAAAVKAAADLRGELAVHEIVVLSTERVRRAEHGKLADAARIMEALSLTVAHVANQPGIVIAKGGITSACIASRGLNATEAWVVGQVSPGISLWHLERASGRLPYLVVPGNMGGPDTLAEIVRELVDQ